MTVQLTLLFLFFMIASVSDIATGKVRNKDILVFLALGFLYYAAFTAKGIATVDPDTFTVLKLAGANLLIAFAVSFGVRSAGVWPAGDAKTYVVANLLIPMSCYGHIYFKYFPGFTLLLNVFMAGVLYIIYKSGETLVMTTLASATISGTIETLKKTSAKLVSEWASHIKVFSSYLIAFFTMNIIYQAIHSRTQMLERVAPESFLVLLFFIMRPVGGFVNNRLKTINHFELYVLFAIAVFFVNEWSFNKSIIALLKMSLDAMKFIAFYGAIRVIADYYINRSQIIHIEPSALKEGDLPAKEFLDSLSAEARSGLRVSPEGLSAEETAKIQDDLRSRKENDAQAIIYKPIPFVPIIFAGVLFTVIAGISSAHYLKLLIFK